MRKLLIIILSVISITSCSTNESNELKVTVNGQGYNMQAKGGFYKFIDSANEEVVMNIWRAEGEHPQVWIYLPTDVHEGNIYTEKDYVDNLRGFSVFYSTPNDEGYIISLDLPFNLEITKWDGVGGIAKGKFSGTLKKWYTDEVHLISITNGSFESFISSKIDRP